MRHYNLIAIVDAPARKLLFCKRRKPPYEGLYNFVGGGIEPGEEGLDAAYRELWEETGIPRDAVALTKLMVLAYPALEDLDMEVYAGRLREDRAVAGSENELVWLDVKQDYADEARFAGVGNLGHIVAYIRRYTHLLEEAP